MNLVLIITTFIGIVINSCCANSCIHSYPNYTIDYISENIDIDESIYYLGSKLSSNECKNSCIHLNYICDTSSHHIIYNHPNDRHFQFNNEECLLKSSVPSDVSIGSTVLLTSDLISNEYIIELQVTIASGSGEAGIAFKAAKPPDDTMTNYYAYYFGVYPDVGSTVTGYTIGTNYEDIHFKDIPSKISYNTKLNITVHVIDATFTTYLNGDVIYTTIYDESLWVQSYAGVYNYRSDAIFHSFKVIFEDEEFCAAFMYNKDSGDCYGYYGDDYVAIDDSVLPDTQSKHDSAVLYDTATCAPTEAEQSRSSEPTTIPTINPTKLSTSNPSKFPSANPRNSLTENSMTETWFASTSNTKLWTLNPNKSLSEHSMTDENDDSLLYSTISTSSYPRNEHNVKKKTISNLFIVIIAIVITFVGVIIGTYILCNYFIVKRQDQKVVEITATTNTNTKTDNILDKKFKAKTDNILDDDSDNESLYDAGRLSLAYVQSPGADQAEDVINITRDAMIDTERGSPHLVGNVMPPPIPPLPIDYGK